MIQLALAALVIALISSTREGRAEASRRLKPLERWLLIPTVLLWLALLWPH